jgi:hypothetical protein
MLGLDKVAKAVFGSSNDRYLKSLRPLVKRINDLEPQIVALSDEALQAQTPKLKAELAAGNMLVRITMVLVLLAMAFAVATLFFTGEIYGAPILLVTRVVIEGSTERAPMVKALMLRSTCGIGLAATKPSFLVLLM